MISNWEMKTGKSEKKKLASKLCWKFLIFYRSNADVLRGIMYSWQEAWTKRVKFQGEGCCQTVVSQKKKNPWIFVLIQSWYFIKEKKEFSI